MQRQFTGGRLAEQTAQFIGQDSIGAQWREPAALTLQNASPLALWAADYLRTGKPELSTRHYKVWPVLTQPVF